MVSRTVKTVFLEICASLLIAALLAGFNLLAIDKFSSEFVAHEKTEPVLLAHGRRGARPEGRQRGGRDRRGRSGRKHEPPLRNGDRGGKSHNDGLGPKQGTTNAEMQPTSPEIPPTTVNEPPALR